MFDILETSSSREKNGLSFTKKCQESGNKKEDVGKNTNDYGEQGGQHYECENINI